MSLRFMLITTVWFALLAASAAVTSRASVDSLVLSVMFFAYGFRLFLAFVITLAFVAKHNRPFWIGSAIFGVIGIYDVMYDITIPEMPFGRILSDMWIFNPGYRDVSDLDTMQQWNYRTVVNVAITSAFAIAGGLVGQYFGRESESAV